MIKTNKNYFSIFILIIFVLTISSSVLSSDIPKIYNTSMIPSTDKDSWFPDHKNKFTSNDKGVIIYLDWYNIEPKEYKFGIKAYRPDGTTDSFSITKDIKKENLDDGKLKWYWEYTFKDDNLLNYPGQWKVEFTLDGKKKGERNFIVDYRHEVLDEDRKSIDYYYKINLDIWLKEDLQKLSKDSLILFAKYISNDYLNYSDEKIIEVDFYSTKEKSNQNLMFTYEKDKIKGIHRIIWNTNNKNLDFPKDKTTKLKPRLSNNEINIKYDIISKINLNYGRYQYDVVVKEKVSINELKKIAREVTERAKTKNNFSGLSIWFYDYEEYSSVGLTLGRVDFAKNGKWENAMSTENGNYEVMSYNYQLRKKDWDKQLTSFEVEVWSAWQKEYDKRLNDTTFPSEEEITNDISDKFDISTEKVNNILYKQIEWTSMDIESE